MRTRTRFPTPCGAALLEAMVGLSVLLFGLIGMMHLQIYGIGANQGARAKMRAGFLANDLAAQLKALPIVDPATVIATPQLEPDVIAVGNACPAPFGYLLLPNTSTIQAVLPAHDGTVPANLPPGVYPDLLIERDPIVPAQPFYQRRWSVCDYIPPASSAPPVKLIAASVIYRESISNQPREVVVYAQVSSMANLAQNLTAFR